MSLRKLTDASATSNRDYGAIASTSHLPEVNFSGFSPTEFMSLSEDIGHNIQQVHSSGKKLEKLLKVIGTSRERANTREEAHSIQTRTNVRIQATSKDIQRLSAVVRRGDKQQKLQLEKLTNDFQAVVERYSAVQKDIVTALRKVLAAEPMHDEERLVNLADMEHQQRSIEADMQHELALQEEREQQILEIESNIVDVNTIMCTIASNVSSQGVQVVTIENSIDSAVSEVQLGQRELAKSSQQRQTHRRRILILLIIAVIIGLIVTGIIVGKFMG